jgi:hypothetical protein
VAQRICASVNTDNLSVLITRHRHDDPRAGVQQSYDAKAAQFDSTGRLVPVFAALIAFPATARSLPRWKRSGEGKGEEQIHEETVDPVEDRTGPDAPRAGEDKDKEGRHDSDLKHRIEANEPPVH